MKKTSNFLKLTILSAIGCVIVLTIIRSNLTEVSATGSKYTAVVQDYFPQETKTFEQGPMETNIDFPTNSQSNFSEIQVDNGTTSNNYSEKKESDYQKETNTFKEPLPQNTVTITIPSTENSSTLQTEQETSPAVPQKEFPTINSVEQKNNSVNTTVMDTEQTIPKTQEETSSIVQETIPSVTVKEESTVPVVSSPTYTNVIYSGYNGDRIYYNSLQEARDNISVTIMLFEDAKTQAVQNKVVFKEWVDEIYKELNNYRISSGKSPLELDDTLVTIAMHRAVESAYSDWNMTAIENGKSKRHIRPNFQIASSILNEYGISGNYGENYARWYYTPDELMTGWKNSSGHNAIMLNEHFTRVGIGVALDKDDAPYWIMILL